MMSERESTSPAAGISWWSVAAVVCVFAAGVALLMNRAEASFVLAALGALAWFLNVRSNLPRVDDPVADESEDVEADDETADDRVEIGRVR